MKNAADISAALSVKKIAQLVGVKQTAVYNAVSVGRFPASWFDVIEAECARRGIPCDRNLFAFKRASEASEDAA